MMTRFSRPLILAALLTLVALIPATARAASSRSLRPSATPAAAVTPAQLALVLPLVADTAGLQRFADAVSTPSSKLYHRYASVAWLAKRFGASSATTNRVVSYLRGEGASDVTVSDTGLFVEANMRSAVAERLFSTGLAVHADRAGAYTTPTSSVRIPSALHGLVTSVVGLDTAPAVSSGFGIGKRRQSLDVALDAKGAFSSISARSVGTAAVRSDNIGGYVGTGYLGSTGGTASGCPAATGVGGFTPNEYLGAYGYGPLQSEGVGGQGERVALIEIDGFKLSDIATFDQCFGIHTPAIKAYRTDSQVSAHGLPAGLESTLDLELLSAAAPDLSQIDVYESGSSIPDVIRSIIAPLEGGKAKPEVISASLGLCELQASQEIGTGGLKDVEAVFQEAAATGITVLAASGDDGSADCTDAENDAIPRLAVNFPASSPYVTSVGGTNITLTATNQLASQVVWNDGNESPSSGGGGGYSTIFRRPSYQNGVTTSPTRVVPDVSGLADIYPGYDLYCTASSDCVSKSAPNPWIPIGGTSAITPLLAGGMALVDQELRIHKQQSLGLVNPLLYKLAENPTDYPVVFSDVTTGSNDVGPYIQADQKPLGCCSAGPGFDAASGLGSVNVSALATDALALEPALVNVAQKVPANRGAVAHKTFYDTVSCSGACNYGAYAKVIIGTRSSFVLSRIYHRTRAGTRLVTIPITKSVLAKMRVALARHQKVRAQIVGVIVDASGDIERSTGSKTVTVTS